MHTARELNEVRLPACTPRTSQVRELKNPCPAESMFCRRAGGELVELLNLFDNSDQIQFILTPFDELQFT